MEIFGPSWFEAYLTQLFVMQCMEVGVETGIAKQEAMQRQYELMEECSRKQYEFQRKQYETNAQAKPD